MNILLTGGAGFIGSALVRYLIEQTNHYVINVDKLTYAANLKALESVAGNIRYVFEQSDIGNRVAMERIVHQYQPQAVINLAAESHVDRSIDSSSVFMQTNVLGTFTLLEVVREYWQGLPEILRDSFRFHQVSTDEVYGDANGKIKAFDEYTAYAPSNPYSASKASADHLVRAWHRTYGLPILITHSTNNYGYYQCVEKFIPAMISKAVQGQHLCIYGDGQQIRDWLYVDDHARALYQVLIKGKVGETYHIAGRCRQRNLEVVHKICQCLEQQLPNKPKNVQCYTDLIRFVDDRAGHDKSYHLDDSKIRQQLYWQPMQNFDEGLKKTVAWYIQYLQA